MTLSTAGYTVGGNQPLNHARILWQPITGTVSASGTNGALAVNDLTAQRWAAVAGRSTWVLNSAPTVPVDTIIIAAHNLAGKTIRVQVGFGATRTNRLVASELFSGASWTATSATVTADATAAPDGPVTADKLVETAVAGTHFINQAVTGRPTNTTHTFSCFVRAAERTRGQIRMDSGSDAVIGAFDLVAGTIIGSANGLGVVGAVSIVAWPGGWWRVSVSGVPNPTTTSYSCQINLRDAAGSASYTGDGTSGLFVWGGQFEQAAGASDYIPTLASPEASEFVDVAPWITPADNDTIAIMANNAGVPWLTKDFRIVIGDGTGVTVGIIRAGVALQMERPFYGGHAPLNWNRTTEAEPQVTEGGQWVGQIVRRISQRATYDWSHLTQAWYDANFEPFARSLPTRPFGIIGNPARLGAADVGWCWTGQDVSPQLMGIRDLVSVSLPVTGYAG
jgi:hypothetical protein